MTRNGGAAPSSPAWLAYLATVVLCAVIVAWLMDLQQADLSVPFHYAMGGDSLFYQMLVKTIADHGWFLMNPDLGAPSVLRLEDFPISDNLPLFLIKLLTLFSSESGLVLNLYLLLTFPLTAVAALFAFRSLGLSTPMGVAGSLLYTFLPAHFLRGESHLLLATYFQVPLLILVTLWIARSELGSVADEVTHRGFRSKRLGALAICVIGGS